ncbi:MAG: hypothetical protein ACJ0SL_03335 [Candidatus Rariloculaceae bacterium]
MDRRRPRAAILSLTALFAVDSVGQSPPPSALINQRADDTAEAARAASPHTSEGAFAYFQDEAQDAIERAIERVWDPTEPYPEPPRTSWGDPDLSGYWLNSTYTPLERPAHLEGVPLYTPQESIEAFQIAVTTDASVDPATVHYDWTEFGMDYWQSPVRPNLRTSLIVDPPDGRIPAFTAAGQARSRQQARGHTLESRGLYERCIQGNQGPPRTPHARGGNSDFGQSTGQSQVIQTEDHVILVTQANSDVRIFPLDGSLHAPDRVRSWLGDSRAHWEGDTLVVETTNFHDKRKWQGSNRNLHLIERFTRVADDILLYEATITDPTTWVSPWSIEVPWPMLDPPGMYEFACHEQNYGIINVVRGAQIRAAEYEADLQP